MSPRLLRPRASGFNPRSITGLETWWDAADSAFVTQTGSPARVAGLNDKSGKGRNATNTTAGATQPLYVSGGQNGRNVVRFSVTDQTILQVPSSQSFYEFLHNGTKSFVAWAGRAGNVSDPNVLMGLIGTGGSTNVGFGLAYDDRAAQSRNNAVVVWAGNALATATSASSNEFLPNAPAVIAVSLDIGNATASERIAVRVNGGSALKTNSASGTPPTGNSGNLMTIGTNSQFQGFSQTGDLYECLIYSSLPDDAAIARITNYLKQKWGI